jgi:hypothetical protein
MCDTCSRLQNIIVQLRPGWFSRHEIVNRLNAATLALMVGNWTVVQHSGCCVQQSPYN